MIKKTYYVSVVGNDKLLQIDIFDIFDQNDYMIVLAHILRSSPEYFKILSVKSNIIYTFSILDYLASFIEKKFDVLFFKKICSEIQSKLTSLDVKTIFLLWLQEYDIMEISSNFKVIQEILTTYKIHLAVDEVAEEMTKFSKEMDQLFNYEEDKYNKLMKRIEILNSYTCVENVIIPFTTRKIRISMKISDVHSLYYFLDHIELTDEWFALAYRELLRSNDPIENEDIFSERDVEVLMIYNRDLEQMIELHYTNVVSVLEIVLDVKPFEDMNDIYQYVQEILGNNIVFVGTSNTLSVSGVFYIKNKRFDKLLFQDFVMNDKIARHYFYINELEKATKYGDNIYIHFEDYITASLINSTNDPSPKPNSLVHYQGSYIKVNVVKAKPMDNLLLQNTSTSHVSRFQEILCSIFGRFYEIYNTYQPLYKDIIPSFTIKTLNQTEFVEKQITNFADKYKYVFKSIGYKTSCRPKSRIPTIITREEAKAKKNPLTVILFPKENDPNLDIPREYLTCNDPNYPFPGITVPAGGGVHVPCCFNKNPVTSKAFREYYANEKVVTVKTGSEHIKSESQIIKTFGDIGKLSYQVLTFLLCLMPDMTFYRMGTIDSANSILHSLNHMKGFPLKTDEEIRKEIYDYFKDNLDVCFQENPSKTEKMIEKDVKDPSIYFDPRLYIRLLEVYYNANIIIFSKTKKAEDIHLVIPNFKGFYRQYSFDKNKPFVFIFEHWGTSPDRYTKRRFPVCEMIISQAPNHSAFKLHKKQLQDLNLFYRQYYLISPLTLFVPILDNVHIHSQIIDDWGKMRGMLFEIGIGKYIYIESEQPLPPLHIKKKPKIDMVIIPTLEFLQAKLSPFEIINRVEYNGKKYIQCRYLGLIWKIQVKSPIEFQKIDRPFLLWEPTEKIPSILSFEKRLARIIVDYVLYLYSKYPDTNIHEFLKKHTKIITGYKYPTDLSELINDNPKIMDNDILILYSESLREKLRFNIKHSILYNNDELEKLKTFTFLPHYWESPFDFSNWKEIRFVSTNDPFSKDICVEQISFNDISNEKGYWYYRDESQGLTEPFMYRKVNSVEEGTNITIFWNRFKYIPSFKLDNMTSDKEIDVITNINGKWDKIYEKQENIEPIFIGINKKGTLYVLLKIDI
jgi:hypothetical protein